MTDMSRSSEGMPVDGRSSNDTLGKSAVDQQTSGDEVPGDVVPTGTLRWAIRLLYVEASATVLLTLVTLWASIAAANISVSSAFATTAFTGLCALILAGLAAALARSKALARGPAIVVQMLLIPLGYYMIGGGLLWLGLPVMIVGVLGAGLLLAPSTRTTLGLR